MATKKVGELIKEARTAKGYTQEQLARKIAGLSASDISKAERGEIALTQTQLREIAKVTGVTQKSLLDAPSGVKKSSSTTGKTTASKKTSSAASTIKLTAEEKKLLKLYRNADTKIQKTVMTILQGENITNSDNILGSLIETAAQAFLK